MRLSHAHKHHCAVIICRNVHRLTHIHSLNLPSITCIGSTRDATTPTGATFHTIYMHISPLQPPTFCHLHLNPSSFAINSNTPPKLPYWYGPPYPHASTLVAAPPQCGFAPSQWRHKLTKEKSKQDRRKPQSRARGLVPHDSVTLGHSSS